MVNVKKVSGKRPLYYKYERQPSPQPAFIYLDCKDELLYAGCAYEDGWTEDEYYEHVLRWPFSSALTSKKVNETLKRIEALAQRVVDGYDTTMWNGKLIAKFDEDATHAIVEIEDTTYSPQAWHAAASIMKFSRRPWRHPYSLEAQIRDSSLPRSNPQEWLSNFPMNM